MKKKDAKKHKMKSGNEKLGFAIEFRASENDAGNS